MTVYCCPFHHESYDHEAPGFSRSDSAYRRQLYILRYAQIASLRAIHSRHVLSLRATRSSGAGLLSEFCDSGSETRLQSFCADPTFLLEMVLRTFLAP